MSNLLHPKLHFSCKIVFQCSEEACCFYFFFLTTSVPLHKRLFKWVTPIFIYEKNIFKSFIFLCNFVFTRKEGGCVWCIHGDQIRLIGLNCGVSVLRTCLGTELANRSPVFRVPGEVMTGPLTGQCVLGEPHAVEEGSRETKCVDKLSSCLDQPDR